MDLLKTGLWVEIRLTLVPGSVLGSSQEHLCSCQCLDFPCQSDCYARVYLPALDSQLAEPPAGGYRPRRGNSPFLTAERALPTLADGSHGILNGQPGIPFESNVWSPFQLASCMAKHLGTVNNWKGRTEIIKGQPHDFCVVSMLRRRLQC